MVNVYFFYREREITYYFKVIVLGCRLMVPDSEKRKGRFNLGRWSRPVNIIGLLWAFFATLAFTLPTNWPITGTKKEMEEEREM